MCAEVCQGVSSCAKCAKVCQGVSKCVKVCQAGACDNFPAKGFRAVGKGGYRYDMLLSDMMQ